MSYVSVTSHLSEGAPVSVRGSAADEGEAVVSLGQPDLHIMVSMPPSELLDWVHGFRYVDGRGAVEDFYVLSAGTTNGHMSALSVMTIKGAIHQYLAKNNG